MAAIAAANHCVQFNVRLSVCFDLNPVLTKIALHTMENTAILCHCVKKMKCDRNIIGYVLFHTHITTAAALLIQFMFIITF